MKTSLFFCMVYFLGFYSNAYAGNYKPGSLKTNNNVKFYLNNNHHKSLGIDERNIHNDEIPLRKLLYIHDLYRTYMRLKNPYLSDIEKIEIANKYLKENTNQCIQIHTGGLLDDWDFDFDKEIL